MKILSAISSLLLLLLPQLCVAQPLADQEPRDIGQELLEADPTPEAPAPTPQKPLFPKLDPSVALNFTIKNVPDSRGRIAFSASVDGYERIFVADLQSKRVSTLVDGPGNNFFPVWSPDGHQLAFVSDRLGEHAIFLADWDGSNQRPLTKGDYSAGDPAWHPNGKDIVYYQDEDNPKHTNLWSVNTDTLKRTRITHFSGRNSTPTYHPNGDSVAYSTNRFWPGWDVCVFDLKTKLEKCILKGKNSYCRPEWSRDGSKVYFSYGGGNELDIGVVVPGEKQLQNLTSHEGKEYDPKMSRSGNDVIYCSDNDSTGSFHISLLSDKKENELILIDSPYSLRYPSWTDQNTLELEVARIKAAQANQEHERKLPPHLEE
ncbi:MAG: PD40 domain-containing protein [Bdellovibrionales bacterium]|nr:PD40 domain-containing protein [Bdellovibrionales bacterium]